MTLLTTVQAGVAQNSSLSLFLGQPGSTQLHRFRRWDIGGLGRGAPRWVEIGPSKPALKLLLPMQAQPLVDAAG